MGAVFGAGAGVLGEGISAIANRRAAARARQIEADYDPAFDAQRQPAEPELDLPLTPPPDEPQAPPPPPQPPPEPPGVLPPTLPPPPAMELPAPLPAPFTPPPPAPPLAAAPADVPTLPRRAQRSYDDELADVPPDIEALLPEADALDARADLPSQPQADVTDPLFEQMAQTYGFRPGEGELPGTIAPPAEEDVLARLMHEAGITEDALSTVQPVEELAGVGVNACGESAASGESISRYSGMTDRGQRFAVRTRAGYRDLPAGEFVAYQPQRGEEYGVIDADGYFQVLSRGENAPTSPAPRAPRLAPEGRKVGTVGSDAAEPGGVYRMAPTELEVRPRRCSTRATRTSRGSWRRAASRARGTRTVVVTNRRSRVVRLGR